MKQGMGSIFPLVVVVLVLPVSTIFAGECAEPAGAWPWPYGQVNAVATVGDYAYFGIDRVLVVADVTDPVLPVVVGMVDLPLPATDIAVSHSHAFVGTKGEGLRIIDVHEPEAPFEAATYMPLRGKVMGLSLDGSNLWAAVEHDGLRVLDITSPTAPVVVASRDISELSSGMDIEVVPPLAYMATGVGVLVLNTQVPDFPERVGYIKVPARSVAAGNGYVYGLNGYGYLSAIDVSWPATPFLVTQKILDGRDGRLTVSDGFLFVACGSDLTVFPADSPESWWAVSPGTHSTGAWAFDVSVGNGRAFLAAGSGGLQSLDVTEPMEPTQIGRVKTAGTVLDAVDVGALRYVVDCPYPGFYYPQPQGPCTLRVLDLSSGPVPTQVGSVEVADVPIEIAVSDVSVFVLSEGGLRIIDVSDPVSPVEVSADSWQYQAATGLAVADGYAYISMISSYPGLRVLDVRTPTSPELVGWVDGEFTDVAVSGNLAALSRTGLSFGLWIYDVSDPTSPVEIGNAETPGHPLHIAVSGNHAFLAQGDIDGFSYPDPQVWIYDLSVPSAPVLAGTIEMADSVFEEFVDIEASGGHIYLATIRYDTTLKTVLYPRSGVRTVDVSDPSAPVGLGFYETKGDAQRVSVTPRGEVIVADGWVGFEVLDVEECQGFILPPSNVRQPGGRVTP